MRIVAAYCVHEDHDQYHVVLDCGCDFPVSEGMLTQADFACPLHEEYRFFNDPPQPPMPPLSLFDDDDWEEPH